MRRAHHNSIPWYEKKSCPVCQSEGSIYHRLDDEGFCSAKCREFNRYRTVKTALTSTQGSFDFVEHNLRMLSHSMTTREDFDGAARAFREVGEGATFPVPEGEPELWPDKRLKTVQNDFVRRSVAVIHRNYAKKLQPQAKAAAIEAVREVLRPYGFSLTERQALEFIAPNK